MFVAGHKTVANQTDSFVVMFVHFFFLFCLVKKYASSASLPELFSRDAVLEELGVFPEDIKGV